MSTERTSTRTRLVGKREVMPIGVGGARLSLMPPPGDQPVRTLCAALDSGVQVIDTAAVYTPDLASPGHNERLIADAIRAWGGDPSSVLVATKGGHMRVADGLTAESFGVDGRPEAIRAHCEDSLRALGTDRIDLYFLHWPDPNVPITESMGALEELRREGKVDLVGLSNVSVEQLEAAGTVGTVDAVQNRFSLFARESLDVVRRCAELGVAFLAYSPLSGTTNPRFDTSVLGAVAAEYDVSPQRVALAWLLEQTDVVIPLVGAGRPETARDSAAAANLFLTDEDVRQLTDMTLEAKQ